MPLLPIVLVIRIALFPDLPAIHFDRYESEKECRAVARVLADNTRLTLGLTCEIDT